MQDHVSNVQLPPSTRHLGVFVQKGCGYLGFRRDDAQNTKPSNSINAVLPTVRMPLDRIATWFDRNGSLTSNKELIMAQPQYNHEKAVDHIVLHHQGTTNDAINTTTTTTTTTKNPDFLEHGNHSCSPLATTVRHSIPTALDINVSIYPVSEVPSPPSSTTSPAGITFLMVTETLHRQSLLSARTPKQVSRYYSYLMITNCSGYVVSDFCGIGGFQQIVFFPVWNHVGAEEGSSSLLQKDNYESFLLQGAVLTDGMDTWLPTTCSMGTVGDAGTSSSREDTKMPLIHQVSLSSWIYEGKCAQICLSSVDASSVPSAPTGSGKYSHDSSHYHQQDENPSRKRTFNGATKGWRNTLEMALAKQLRQRQHNREKQLLFLRGRDYVLGKSREALQQLIRNDYHFGIESSRGSSSIPQRAMTLASKIHITELRFRVYPRTSRAIGTTSVNVWTEVDLMIPSAHHTNNKSIMESTEKIVVLKDFHLYCTPSKSRVTQDEGTENNSPVAAVCQSAIASSLSCGDHVTLTVSLELDHVFLSKDDESSDNSGVELIVESIGVLVGSTGGTGRRCGFSLGSFFLPYRAILQAPFQNKLYRCLFPANDPNRPHPSTIYDCRAPHKLMIDVSSCPRFSLPNLLDKLNRELCGRCPVRVDRGETQKDDVASFISLTIFAMKRSEVLGKLVS